MRMLPMVLMCGAAAMVPATTMSGHFQEPNPWLVSPGTTSGGWSNAYAYNMEALDAIDMDGDGVTVQHVADGQVVRATLADTASIRVARTYLRVNAPDWVEVKLGPEGSGANRFVRVQSILRVSYAGTTPLRIELRSHGGAVLASSDDPATIQRVRRLSGLGE